jgi:N-terminal domain of toast_rack, DUF2154
MMRIMTVLAVASLAACGHVQLDTRERETRNYRESIDLSGAKEASTEFHMGAGELRITGGAGTKLVQADIRTSGARPEFRYNGGSRGRLVVRQDSKTHLGDQDNDWDIQLTEEIPIDIELHLGAGKAQLDLGDLHLRHLVLHIGAGELDLDLRGNYLSDVDVEIHGGVGEAKVRLPKKMRIDAEVHGGLGEIDARGLTNDDGHYTNRGDRSGPKMTLEIHGGIGRIELNAE